MLSVLIPPFQVPDEQQHLFRAYQLASGQVRAEVRDGVAGGVVPSSLVEFAERSLGSRALHPEHRVAPTPLGTTLAALHIPLEPERTEFVNFTGAAFYSPIPYLPQVVAVLAGRAAGLGPLGLLYAARIANGLTAVVAVAAALAILPAGGTLLLVFALLPMTAFMFASASPDAGTIAFAFLFTAIVFRAGLRGVFRPGEVLAAALAGIVFCALKPVYAPLLVIAAPAVFRRGSTRNVLLAQVAILVAVLGATALWFSFSASSMVSATPGRTPSAQVDWITHHPTEFVLVLAKTLRLFATDWIREVIGKLGWHEIWLPPYLYWLAAVAIALGLILPRPRQTRPGALDLAWYALLIAASAVLVMVALYVSWTGIGNGFVGGIQGRYFTPLLALVAIAAEGAVPILRKSEFASPAMVVLALLQVVLTGAFLVRTYDVL